jgi:hypothetical protein
VYRPASIFLLGTPYEKHRILYGLPAIPMETHPVVSFDFRAPLGIEPWDIFEMEIFGVTDPNAPEEPIETANAINIVITPLEPPAGACIGPLNSTEGMYGMASAITGLAEGQMQVSVAVGRGLLDGSWHAVWVNLQEAVAAAIEGYNADNPGDPLDLDEWQIAFATGVVVSGQMFRMDNLFFRAAPGYQRFLGPDLFEMGPLYAQLFEPYQYLFIADYDVGEGGVDVYDADFLLDANSFITDPNAIEDYWLSLGADPNLMDTANDPNIAALLGVPQFVVAKSLPIFGDPELRVDPNTGELGDKLVTLRQQGTLGWNLTVNSYGANAIQTVGALNPLPVVPGDFIPGYLPAHYDAVQLAKATGRSSYDPVFAFLLESALYGAGVSFWPNIAALNFTPYYFEDLILTIEVSNGARSDVRTFPLSVVNYPVENYAPVLQLNVEDQIFYVGEVGEYLVNFIDPDCFIFSLAAQQGIQPATTHVPGARNDMATLTWGVTLNGLPSYQYGPWIEAIVQPASGLISWIPKFEGAYDTVVTCTDARGDIGFGEITIFAVQRGTWLNHPPIVLNRPTQPVVIKAGEEFIMPSSIIEVEDPDGDAIYASCNIGTCGRLQDGAFTWKFQSNFPGSYVVEIVFYDIRGGYAIVEFFLDVKPWWSY